MLLYFNILKLQREARFGYFVWDIFESCLKYIISQISMNSSEVYLTSFSLIFFFNFSPYGLNIKMVMCIFIVFLISHKNLRSVSESSHTTWCMLRSSSAYFNRELTFVFAWLPHLFMKASRLILPKPVKFWCLMKVMLYSQSYWVFISEITLFH